MNLVKQISKLVKVRYVEDITDSKRVGERHGAADRGVRAARPGLGEGLASSRAWRTDERPSARTQSARCCS